MDLMNKKKLWLGFDLSTQQLKAVAINEQLEIAYEANVHFDNDLPEFRTNGGVIRDDKNNTVNVPVLMWIKALDMLLDRLRINGLDYSEVIGISGGGQQHGSVYWKRINNNANTKLGGVGGPLAGSANWKRDYTETVLNFLDSSKFLYEQLSDCFSLQNSPIWMDSSTTKQCRELETFVGGPEKLAQITGSRAYERFTGNQIAKIIQTKPEIYNQTERISLISSFLASIFIGRYAPIDLSDGSGMNLLDINKKRWSEECLNYIVSGTQHKPDDLIDKLGPIVVPSTEIIGTISDYFVQRYAFNKDCYVVAHTGDNPASLAGMCVGPNDVVVSLGTSDTIFFQLSTPTPQLDGHILINPIDANCYMGMVVFKNGSLTRERIKNSCANGDWNKFNELLESTPRGNFGNIGFYFDMKEIYPVITGDYRYNRYDNEVVSFAPEVEIRSLIEGQFLRLKIHAENLGFKCDPERTRILATGGASINHSILKVLSDVFNAPVFTNSIPNSAAFGSALLAKYGKEKLDRNISYYEMIEKIQSNQSKFIAKPSSDASTIYGELAERYRKLEDQLNSKI